MVEPRPLVCLGEALVDLISPEPVAEPVAAARFEPHFGGALANVAVAAARAGAPVALAGGCGDDENGQLLRERLRREGVRLDFHSIVEGGETPYAHVSLDHSREPTFQIAGDGIDEGIATLRGRERDLAGAAGAIAFGSNTLPGERAREVTMNVRDAALAAGVPLLFDPNLRRNRWDDLAAARDLCLDLAADSTLLKCNLAEARWLTGDNGSAADVADELAAIGPRLVVVTAGTAPAVARGVCEAEVRPPQVEMVSPLGAGDVFMGTLAASLLAGGFGFSEVEAAMELSAHAAAQACTRLGAFE